MPCRTTAWYKGPILWQHLCNHPLPSTGWSVFSVFFRWKMAIPSGILTVCYWKLPLIVDLPVKTPQKKKNIAFWCFLYVYQRVAGFFPDFPHTVPGRRTSKGGFCAAQRLQSLRWGKFTLPQAGHSQFPFSPSDQTRYPIRSILGCWLDVKKD